MQNPTWTFLALQRADGSVCGWTMLDAADARWARRHKWLASGGYAVRSDGGRNIALHREILRLGPSDGLEADHVNRDRSDNRRCNLRVATRRQNAQNLSSRSRKYPGRRGTTYDKSRGKWIAWVRLNYKRHFLGRFETEAKAARVAAEFRAQHMPFSEESSVCR